MVYDIHFGGGGERVVANLSDIFIEKGYSVTVISLCKKSDSFSFQLNKEVQVAYLNTNTFKIEFLNKIKSLFFLKRYLRKNHFNYILGIGTYLNILLALSKNNRAATKIIGCEHSYFFSVSFFWVLLRKMFYRKLSALVSLTNEDLKNLKELNKNTFVIPNSLSFSIMKQATLKNKKIIALGRISFEKGFDLMLDAFSELCKINNSWILELRGNGSEDEKNKLLVKKHKMEGKVKLLPATNDVISAYMDASIYLMTSRFEGLPMVLLEASECGLPMIAYNCKTGPSEIIQDGENGFLIPCYDKKIMVEKLNMLCNDFELRRRMGEKAKQLAKRFDRDTICKKWIDLFNTIDRNDS